MVIEISKGVIRYKGTSNWEITNNSPFVLFSGRELPTTMAELELIFPIDVD